MPDEEDSLQQQFDQIVDYVDSPGYADEVAWDEHVVLCYRLGKDRDPTATELAILRDLALDPGLTRGEVVAAVLYAADDAERWANIRRFLNRHEASSYRVDESVRATAAELGQVSDATLAEDLASTPEQTEVASETLATLGRRQAASEPGVEYQTYFGFLHAHSHLSDGEGSAIEAYEFARDEGELDFFGLTDHGINLAVSWPCNDKWQRLRAAAEATHAPGSYVTLWGFEWSNPLLGHVGILQSDDFTHTLARIRMSDLYRWLGDRPQAFGRFNHPGRQGFDIGDVAIIREFEHLDLHPDAVPQMVGVELWNKDQSFDRFYYDGSWISEDVSFLDVGLQKGWQLGTLGGQDNHQKEWGTRNDFRTGVLATELTREAILDAYDKRRIYATEDKDLFLDVRVAGFPMGSRVSGVPRQFEVSARDGSGDGFERVRLFRNGVEIASESVSGSPIAVTFNDAEASGDDYYYVIVTQSDDGDGNGRPDEAISSPIWIDDE